MVDLASAFTKMQAYVGFPVANATPPGAKSDSQVKDAFSSLFDNVVKKSFSLKTDMTVQSAEGKATEGAVTEGEEPGLEGENKTAKIPDELAILASYTIQTPQLEAEAIPEENQVVPIQENQVGSILEGNAVPIQETQVGSIQEDNADSAQEGNVVSILEGNMDIEAPIPETKTAAPAQQEQQLTVEAPAAEETGEELTARMPQAPGQTQQTAETEKQPETAVKTNAEVPAEEEGPCPLENKNDSPQTKSSMDSDEDTKEEPKTDYSRAPETQQKLDISPDRVASAEKLNAAADSRPATATTETLFNTMVEKIQMANTSESTFMEIQLKPEFLGKVSIQLALGDTGMEIRIKTEDAGVKGLLSEQINQLKDSLQDKGIKVTGVEVTQTNISDHTFGESASHGRDQAYQTNEGTRAGIRGNLSPSQTGPEGAEAAAVPVIDTGMSSVEYRA